MNEAIEQRQGFVLLQLHVVPGASRTKVVGMHGNRVKLQVAAPPVDGEANDAICRFLSKLLGIPRYAIRISGGASGRQKSFELHGMDTEGVKTALGIA